MPHRTPVLRRTLVSFLAVAALTLAGCVSVSRAAPPSVQTSVVNLVNAHRANVGLPPVYQCGTLNGAAQGQSNYQASIATMTHDGGGGLGARANNAGYRGWNNLGENVAYGYPGVTEVVDAWLASPGHRANLLSTNFTHLGIGLAYHGSTPYWTQDFGRGGTC
ncbi:MAG TPA: CAP domain-containing protein [Acidimicrobiia bacterium]|nr:CAP domain-containing protein [Acidimicrobiia bacterium]